MSRKAITLNNDPVTEHHIKVCEEKQFSVEEYPYHGHITISSSQPNVINLSHDGTVFVETDGLCRIVVMYPEGHGYHVEREFVPKSEAEDFVEAFNKTDPKGPQAEAISYIEAHKRARATYNDADRWESYFNRRRHAAHDLIEHDTNARVAKARKAVKKRKATTA